MHNNDQSVFIVDDDEAIRDSLSMLIGSESITALTFPSAESFLNYFNPDMSGCLLLDVRMPGMSGLDLQKHMNTQNIALPIIVMSGHADVPMAVEMMKNGAFDFYTKPFDQDALLKTIKFCLHECETIKREHEIHDSVEERINKLTSREREVLAGVLAGKASKVIAYELGISVKTVDVHRSRIMEKMKVRSLAQLVRIILKTNQEGLIMEETMS